MKLRVFIIKYVCLSSSKLPVYVTTAFVALYLSACLFTLRGQLAQYAKYQIRDENCDNFLGGIWPEDFPSKGGQKCDRILEQLKLERKAPRTFKILPPDRYMPLGSSVFQSQNCPVDNCEITYDQFEADALIFQNSDVLSDEYAEFRRQEQIWIAYFLESPPNTFDRKYVRRFRGKHQFNWTASYRSDSDIATPYSKFVEYKSTDIDIDEQFKKRFLNNSTVRKFIGSKKRSKVAWLVSNCITHNDRMGYARQLAEHLQVDIFGRCGNLTCEKRDHANCIAMINTNYKFYLAFENSNCPEYITEKFFINALGLNNLDHLVLPIVMGPKREDYELIAPKNSFIHVDDFETPKELAEYLVMLDKHDELYLSHFRWKLEGEFIDTKFICRVCALLNESYLKNKTKTYTDIQSWWNCKI